MAQNSTCAGVLIGDVERHDHVRLTPNTSVDASQQSAALDFPNGSISDIAAFLRDVRFTPESGHCERFYEYTP
jgi:hypothetical protein